MSAVAQLLQLHSFSKGIALSGAQLLRLHNFSGRTGLEPFNLEAALGAFPLARVSCNSWRNLRCRSGYLQGGARHARRSGSETRAQTGRITFRGPQRASGKRLSLGLGRSAGGRCSGFRATVIFGVAWKDERRRRENLRHHSPFAPSYPPKIVPLSFPNQ